MVRAYWPEAWSAPVQLEPRHRAREHVQAVRRANEGTFFRGPRSDGSSGPYAARPRVPLAQREIVPGHVRHSDRSQNFNDDCVALMRAFHYVIQPLALASVPLNPKTGKVYRTIADSGRFIQNQNRHVIHMFDASSAHVRLEWHQGNCGPLWRCLAEALLREACEGNRGRFQWPSFSHAPRSFDDVVDDIVYAVISGDAEVGQH